MRLGALLGPEIEEALRTNPAQLLELVEELHAADLAEVVAELADEPAAKLLATLPADLALEIFSFLELPRRVELFTACDRASAVKLANEMPPDDRADLFAALPEEVAAELLGRMEKEEAADVKELLTWPATSAGGIMTTAYAALSPDHSIEQAIEEVRRSAEEMETVVDVYAVDPGGTLLGAVSLRDLMLAKKGQKVRDVMDPSTRSVDADVDREEVARLFGHYALTTMPVVEPDTRRMLGIVTVDDVVDVMQAIQTEDVHRMAAVSPIEDPYMQASVWMLVRRRLPWLVVLFVAEMFTSYTLRGYHWVEQLIEVMSMYVPLIISAGGNSGSQSSGLLVRALAVGEVTSSQWLKVLWRELAQGLVLGGILAVIGYFRAVAPFPVGMGNGAQVGLVVATSVMGVIVLGTVVGSMLPLIFKRLGFDPAVTSAPFIAVLVDVAGLVIYFNVAIWIFGLVHPHPAPIPASP